MKQLFAVSVLILAVIVSLACEGPAPTPAAPPAPELTIPPATQVVPPMPSPTPTVAPTLSQAPVAARAPTPEPAREATPGPTPTRVPTPTPTPERTPAGERIDWNPCESDPGLDCGFVAGSGGLPGRGGRQPQHRGQRASGHVSGPTDRLSVRESRRPGLERFGDGRSHPRRSIHR